MVMLTVLLAPSWGCSDHGMRPSPAHGTQLRTIRFCRLPGPVATGRSNGLSTFEGPMMASRREHALVPLQPTGTLVTYTPVRWLGCHDLHWFAVSWIPKVLREEMYRYIRLITVHSGSPLWALAYIVSACGSTASPGF